MRAVCKARCREDGSDDLNTKSNCNLISRVDSTLFEVDRRGVTRVA